MKPTLRQHQEQKSIELNEILSKYKLAYLAGLPRTGKTLTALNTASLYGAKSVLVVTRKKAISSIQSDYDLFKFTYDIEIINHESIHKVENLKPCLVIFDEHHVCGSFPKPSKRTKAIKKMFSDVPMILMSGSPFTESYSQVFHQFWISKYSPFKETNFYRWADKYVDKKQLFFGPRPSTDYSNARENEIAEVIEPYMVRITREEADLEVDINEIDVYIEAPKMLHNLAKQLIDERIIRGKTGVIETETPASLASKCHQIYNGSVIIETYDGEADTVVLSNYKAKAIQEYFKGKKIAIMFFFRAELDILKEVFGDTITDCLDEFQTTDKSIAINSVTTEGVNLSKADAIAFYNIGFSGKAYLQARDRLTVKGRSNNYVYFFLEKGGTTSRVLKQVRNKKSFNSKTFLKEFVK